MRQPATSAVGRRPASRRKMPSVGSRQRTGPGAAPGAAALKTARPGKSPRVLRREPPISKSARAAGGRAATAAPRPPVAAPALPGGPLPRAPLPDGPLPEGPLPGGPLPTDPPPACPRPGSPLPAPGGTPPKGTAPRQSGPTATRRDGRVTGPAPAGHASGRPRGRTRAGAGSDAGDQRQGEIRAATGQRVIAGRDLRPHTRPVDHGQALPQLGSRGPGGGPDGGPGGGPGGGVRGGGGRGLRRHRRRTRLLRPGGDGPQAAVPRDARRARDAPRQPGGGGGA